MPSIHMPLGAAMVNQRGQITSLTVSLLYDTRDPYAVVLNFGARLPLWVFARDLLADGLHSQVGEGDVVVRPRHSGVHVTLRPPSGQVTLTFLRSEIAPFVDQMFHLVPRGREHVDLDAALRALGVIA